jgi:hypothetical protein
MKQKSPIVQSKGTTAKKHEYKISSWGERPFGTNGFAEFHDEHKRGLQEYPPMSFSHRKDRSCKRERVFANPVSRTQDIASTNANLQRLAVYNEPTLHFKGTCSRAHAAKVLAEFQLEYGSVFSDEWTNGCFFLFFGCGFLRPSAMSANSSNRAPASVPSRSS